MSLLEDPKPSRKTFDQFLAELKERREKNRVREKYARKAERDNKRTKRVGKEHRDISVFGRRIGEPEMS